MTNIILISCVSFLYFFKTLRYGYCSDDILVFRSSNKKYKGLSFKRFWDSLVGDTRYTPLVDHICTLILHTLVCVFIYIGFGQNNISLAASFLFMVNPANNQGSVWISGRGYVYPTLFLLWTISIPYLAPLFIILTTYFHTGFLSPLILAVSPFKWYLVFVPIAWAICSFKFVKNIKQKVNQEMFGEDKKINIKKLILYFKTFGYYTVLFIIPFRNTFYHSFMQSMAGNEIMKKRAYSIDKFFFAGIFSIALLIYGIYTHPFSLFSLACAWWIIGVSPYCNLFRCHQEIAERYMYHAGVGLSFILATFVINHPYVLAALLSGYATRLWFYMDAYTDDYFLSEVSRINSRDSWFAWHIAAHKRWNNGAYKEAIILWVMAKNISPNEFKILFNIATCLNIIGEDKEAVEYYREAKKHIPLGQEAEIQIIYDNLKKGKAAIIL